MGLFDWCKNVSDTVTLVCGSYLCDNNVSIVPLFVRCVCVFKHGACLQSLTPGVSPQACAGGEEESEEGGGSTAAHLLEALRQFRLHHRGQYRTVLEESLAAYHLRGESTAEGAGESRRTYDDNNDGQEQPASPPSPPSPPPSPATAEPEASQDAPGPESNPSSD